MSTKDLIYSKAVDLFCEYGYAQVGMRDLAKEVGIKAASIYNHYKSKEDILLDIANQFVASLSEKVYPLYKQTHLNPKEFLLNLSKNTNIVFEEAEFNRITQLLIFEKYRSPELRALLHTELIVKPRTAFSIYFKTLMDKGLMTVTDPNLVSRMYHSFFVYHFYEKYLTSNNEMFLIKHHHLFEQHIELFVEYFGIRSD